MPHIHTEANQFDHTVSCFIVKRNPRTVLFHKHKVLGIWLQPGGHIELDEHPWSTVSHELEEETGYNLSQLEVLQVAPVIPGLTETIHPTPISFRSHEFPGAKSTHYHTDAAFGFVANDDPKGEPGEGESTVLHWFTADELEQLSADEIAADARVIALHLLRNIDDYLSIPAESFPH